MTRFGCFLVAAICLLTHDGVWGYNGGLGRRTLLQGVLTAASAALVSANPAIAEDMPTKVYFGVGCFWHIQHEIVEAERKLLGRGDDTITALAGYAGGTQTGKDGRVCYHNMQSIADYGRLGHGEVVGLEIPESAIGDFGRVYFDLFRNGERVDPQDRGGEYRSLIGLPGGMGHPMYPELELAGADKGLKLVAGKGNDPDTLGKKLVYVYDTNEFPFHQAEVYHQFHNDFQSPPYGRKYNQLADQLLDEGRMSATGCPDRV
eukprot:CAMPEP_0116841836 /NCGR_PEP_ID=MMETSP0418-20121206/11175_1 /TAXON_ID=1158023 /ORGANISM="Astrosyne radiata, Strain 13vi08-1A" /LENGTH=260 /DNA_ID=CAMNT_0004472365 /DNA_START=51 /DNA_END=833 /DNA_ORIENTATION=+